MKRIRQFIGRKLWQKWHGYICARLRYKTTKYGYEFRGPAQKGTWLYRLQLPVCKLLDDWDHEL